MADMITSSVWLFYELWWLQIRRNLVSQLFDVYIMVFLS